MNRALFFFLFLTIAIGSTFTTLCYGQFQPLPFNHAFLQNEVASIRITINPDSLNLLLETLENEHEFPATFQYESSVLNETVSNIGFRLRGNTSLNAQKKSFKISFNSFQQGAKWQTLEKINLIGQSNDPSLLRSKLCHDAYRAMGVAASRTSFVKLYVNNEYKGLYLNVEHIDENFAKSQLDQQGDGNLYKCTYPSTLEYLGSNPELYQALTPWGTQPYALHTNRWLNDYSDLALFISVLNNSSIANLSCQLPKVFNVEKYLRTAAIDVITGNWDGYAYNKNNFYLYNNQRSGLMEYIPYDLDNTLGIDWLGVDWTNRNIYNWPPDGENRPLLERLLQVPEYRAKYSAYISQALNGYFANPGFSAYCTSLQSLIWEAAEEDPYRPLDFGFDMNAFANSITTGSGGHVPYGITEYINLRRQSALQQLESITPIPSVVDWVQQQFNTTAGVQTPLIESMLKASSGNTCQLQLSYNNINWFNSGTFGDSGPLPDISNDFIHTYYSSTPLTTNKLYYRVNCSDLPTTVPCTSKFMWTTNSAIPVVINEVMPSNTQFLADEFGEYDDWLELWNSSGEPVSLNNLYLTDQQANWNRFKLPNMTLPGGGFIIVWLDDQPEQGPLHATFKMGNSQNQVWLTSLEEGSPRLVNYFAYPSSPSGELSWERVTDGNPLINFTYEPTPGTSNFIVSTEENDISEIRPFPNPANDYIQLGHSVTNVELTDLCGKLVGKWSNTSRIETTHIPEGLYNLKVEDRIYKHILLH